MRKLTILMAAFLIAISLLSGTTRALAGGALAEPNAPGGTPGAPNQGTTPTGTLEPGQMHGPPSNPGQGMPQNTPGAQATAQAGQHGKPTIYRGTLSAVDASSLTLTLVDGTSVTIAITPETHIRVPGPQAQGDTLVVGMHLVVQAREDSNGNLVARSIMAIPGQPTLTHRVGTVTAYAAGSSLSILAADGQTYSFALTADTKLLPAGLADTLAVDSRVTVIAPRDVSALGWTATGIVVHPPLP
ncbi:MAG TPA: DUF5666 domain-containing protein [Anaerolineales bacterium]|nr:DUF5666 domain-containing protein [Anaerolineales bacterium]